MSLKNIYILAFLLSSSCLTSQTVGLFLNSEESYQGYTLYASNQYSSTFLINNCGQVINDWPSEYTPGLASYLDGDGALVRGGVYRDENSFINAGTGGILQRISWNGIVEWGILINNDSIGLHHDIHLMDNGNVLAIAWERISATEAIEAGRNPILIDEEVWSEVILEIEPIGLDSFAVVWKWKVKDHLIQDFDNQKSNFGSVADHPELIDFNYINEIEKDWIHMNSIYYDEMRDQIVLSAREFDEFWIIDHSTTIEEAASHEGGSYGNGGDLIFRWGNDSAFRNTESLKYLNNQHDVEFLEDGSLLLYNNNDTDTKNSELIRLQPTVVNDRYVFNGSFQLDFEPEYLIEESSSDFSSNILSSVDILPNGNILVNKGDRAEFREFTSDGQLVWLYKGTLSLFGPIEQGTFINGQTFKISKYDINDPRFDGLDVSVKQDNIELNPLPFECDLYTSISDFGIENKANIYYDAISQNIINASQYDYEIRIYSSVGSLLEAINLKSESSTHITLDDRGIYFLDAMSSSGKRHSWSFFTSN